MRGKLSYASEAVGLMNSFLEVCRKHIRSSDFGLGFLLFLIFY